MMSGIYDIGGIQVYCDMTTAGGGWTLAARSAAGAGVGNFGWKQSRGDVNAVSAYSLDTRKIGPFTTLLFGKRGSGNALLTPIFMKTVPPDFLAKYTESAAATRTTTVTGCNPGDQGPKMVEYVGFTNTLSLYSFHDDATLSAFGLAPNGWTSSVGCPAGADLNGEQAAIFVR